MSAIAEDGETSPSPARSRLVSFFCVLVIFGALAGCSEPTRHLESDGASFQPSDEDAAPQDSTESCRSVLPSTGNSDEEAIRVATFNVRRLFDTTCDSGSCSGDSYEETPTERAYETRLARAAEQLATLEADILLLQEIETASVFMDLADALADQGANYDVRVFGETSRPASLDVGILSTGNRTGSPLRFRESRPLTRPDGSSTRFTREFLGVPIELSGADIVVFTAHFKSRGRDDPGRRLAEAKAAGSILAETASDNPEALVLFGGDLNTTPGDEPYEALVEGGGLRRAGSDSSPRPWSYCFEGTREAIDHLFVVPTCGGALLEKTARRWGGSRCPGESGFVDSDHAAISAQFVPR